MHLPNNLFYSYFLTGSFYITDPPTLDTDIDLMYMVYNLETVDKYLIDTGYKKCGVNDYAIKGWAAYRKGMFNVLVTDNIDYYTRFEAATELAKKRNIKTKEDRRALFATICGDMSDSIN